ncbi:MAG TPA: universal stress protein [Thermomicrobiales bacterium]|nr:universal stress protein [Thermomicrobiales bacterium]
MFDRVLVPLDGSRRAERALDLLPALPCRHVLLLRATSSDGSPAPVVGGYLASIAATLAERGLAAETREMVGDPAESIVAAAIDVDLIAMTSRGQGAGGRLLFGSVADRVARHAPAPTLILRTEDDVALPAVDGRIVVPLDGSPVAARAIDLARRLSWPRPRPLHLIGVVADADGGDAPDRALPAHLDAVAAELQADGIGATVEVRRGDPEIELVTAVRGGDLVVMTTHGASGGQRWRVGHVAEQMLRRSPAPVVLVRGDHTATAASKRDRGDP